MFASAIGAEAREAASSVRRIGLEVVAQQISLLARSLQAAGSNRAQVAVCLSHGKAIRISNSIERRSHFGTTGMIKIIGKTKNIQILGAFM